MISSSARKSLDRMIIRSLQETFPTASGLPPEISAAAHSAPEANSQMVMLMISSHTFRIVIALRFPGTPEAMRYLSPLHPMDGDTDMQGFRDGMSERGNMCCGMVNREIGLVFTHTGMSTPHIIDGRSAPFLTAVPHEYATHWHIRLDEQLQFSASLCVHSREPMDFEWHPDAQNEVAGELELF